LDLNSEWLLLDTFSDKFIEGKAYSNNELNEIGIAHILYSGYYNNLLDKGCGD